jgi:hypothetical protein
MHDDDHGTRLAMLTRPMATEQNATMSPLAQVAINGIAWVDHGMRYSLGESRPTEALHPIADERRQIPPTPEPWPPRAAVRALNGVRPPRSPCQPHGQCRSQALTLASAAPPS